MKSIKYDNVRPLSETGMEKLYDLFDAILPPVTTEVFKEIMQEIDKLKRLRR